MRPTYSDTNCCDSASAIPRCQCSATNSLQGRPDVVLDRRMFAIAVLARAVAPTTVPIRLNNPIDRVGHRDTELDDRREEGRHISQSNSVVFLHRHSRVTTPPPSLRRQCPRRCNSMGCDLAYQPRGMRERLQLLINPGQEIRSCLPRVTLPSRGPPYAACISRHRSHPHCSMQSRKALSYPTDSGRLLFLQ